MNLPPAVKALWEDKPLLITVVVGLGILLYVLYKSNKGNVIAPTGTTAAGDQTGGGNTYTTVEISGAPSTTTIYNPAAPAPVPVPVPAPAPSATVPHTPGSAKKIPNSDAGKKATSTSSHPATSVATSTPKKNPSPASGTTKTTTTKGSSTSSSKPTTSTKIVLPAPKGSLGVSGAGKGDTNFSVIGAPTNVTLLTLAQIANFGTAGHPDWMKFVNYRNNRQVLISAGVDVNNPAAPVPKGLKVSI